MIEYLNRKIDEEFIAGNGEEALALCVGRTSWDLEIWVDSQFDRRLDLKKVVAAFNTNF